MKLKAIKKNKITNMIKKAAMEEDDDTLGAILENHRKLAEKIAAKLAKREVKK